MLAPYFRCSLIGDCFKFPCKFPGKLVPDYPQTSKRTGRLLCLLYCTKTHFFCFCLVPYIPSVPYREDHPYFPHLGYAPYIPYIPSVPYYPYGYRQ